jgi:hypothetical protein
VEAVLQWPMEEGSCTDEFIMSLGTERRNRREKKDEGGLIDTSCMRRNQRLKLLRLLKKNREGRQVSAL